MQTSTFERSEYEEQSKQTILFICLLYILTRLWVLHIPNSDPNLLFCIFGMFLKDKKDNNEAKISLYERIPKC